MKLILHELQRILSLQPSLLVLWDFRYNIVGSEPSSEGSGVMECFLKLNGSKLSQIKYVKSTLELGPQGVVVSIPITTNVTLKLSFVRV
jgi:hypothetical protein